MKCACGSGLFSSVAVVVGLVAVGFGGYNWATTGCPLGSCRPDAVSAAPEKAAVITPASTTTVNPVTTTKGEAKDACCSGKTEGCAKEGCEKDKATCEHHEVAEAPKAPQG